ncbi:MAG: DUF2550 domain-containing protein [Kribbellaceae bacterium]|nr:DUF2550 domain-containing protein [Kribbellaceae bacterium]
MGWILDVVGVVLVCFVLFLVAFASRRRWITRDGGTFDCSLRLYARHRDMHKGRGWALGLGRYVGDELQWFRVFSLSLRPKRTWNRRRLEGVRHRRPIGNEPLVTYAGHVIVDVFTDTGSPVELAMTEDALTGLLAWLESAPPGAQAYSG